MLIRKRYGLDYFYMLWITVIVCFAMTARGRNTRRRSGKKKLYVNTSSGVAVFWWVFVLFWKKIFLIYSTQTISLTVMWPRCRLPSPYRFQKFKSRSSRKEWGGGRGYILILFYSISCCSVIWWKVGIASNKIKSRAI